MNKISQTELKQLISSGKNPMIIDLRKGWERASLNVGGYHCPHNQIKQRGNMIRNMAKNRQVVIGCLAHYTRAKQALPELRRYGIDALVLEGGITGWAANQSLILPQS